MSSGANRLVERGRRPQLGFDPRRPHSGALYEDPGADYFERRNHPAKEAKRLQRKVEALGFEATTARRPRSPGPDAVPTPIV